MYRLYCRVYQFIFRLAMYILPWRKPEILSGFSQMAKVISEHDVRSVLLVTDAGIANLKMHEPVFKALHDENIRCVMYDRTVANPTVGNIEQALRLYHENDCKAIIALGGGSPMDCAKGVGARVAHSRKRIDQMRGVLKVLYQMPLFIAVPTTSGTGSETTLAAVITDTITHRKYAISDPALIPHYAVLDPKLTASMPPHITATTGMDALCHAVEAYIGHSNTKQTKQDALEAVRLIFENLELAYRDGSNLAARANMQRAAYLAGAAFTRAYVGNIHAMSHALSAKYGTAHGLANAVIMPYVLNAYGDKVNASLGELAAMANIVGENDADKAIAFIAAIRLMNKRMNIPDKIDELKEQDIDALSDHACDEANPLYPVPVIFLKREMKENYRKLLKEA